MSGSAALSLSAVLLLSGILGFFLISHLIKYLSNSRRNSNRHYKDQFPVHISENDEAYVIVEARGNILYSNSGLRNLINLSGRKVNLEQVAKKLHPQETFFALCAKEGKARFTLGDSLYEGRSYRLPHNSATAMLVSFQKLNPRLLIKDSIRVDSKQAKPSDGSPSIEDSSSPLLHNEPSSKNTVNDFSDFSLELGEKYLQRTHQLRLEHQRTETLLRILTELSSSFEFEKILQRTLEILNEVIGASHATCMVLQADNRNLRHLATVGYSTPLPPGGMPSALNINQGLVGWIIANRQSVLIRDVLEDERWMQLPNSWYRWWMSGK